jgi:hypothetical protein
MVLKICRKDAQETQKVICGSALSAPFGGNGFRAVACIFGIPISQDW